MLMLIFASLQRISYLLLLYCIRTCMSITEKKMSKEEKVYRQEDQNVVELLLSLF